MTDVFTKTKRSEVMSRILSKGNKETEFVLATIFREHDIKGWRRHLALTGKPDFAFRKEKLAVFVDGCFWHGCPRCYRRPSSRREYWDAKYRRNKQRDRDVSKQLRGQGWRVLRIWHHELRKPANVIERVRRHLQRA